MIVIIPSYNEVANLPTLLGHLDAWMASREIPYRVIVVDDGSTDGTSAILSDLAGRLPLIRVGHERNLGPGRAFQTGFRKAMALLPDTRDDETPVVTLEADNTSDLEILGDMFRAFASGADLVLASCYARGGGVRHTDRIRVFLSAAANILMRTIFRLHAVRTYSSFYRVYRARLLRRALQRYDDRLIEEKGFACMVELLVKLREFRPVIAEIPMILDCHRRQGQSKMRVVRTIAAYLRLIARLKLSLPC